MEIALQLLKQDSQFEEGRRGGLIDQFLDHLGTQVVLVALDETQDQMLILFHQVSVSVVGSVLDFARLLGLRDQTLQLLLVKLEQLLVEEDLLGDSAQAQLLCDENLRLFADRGDKEHEGVAERLAFRCQFAILRLVSIRLQQELDLTVHEDN